jgi:crotonobetainyl-CoA:carnitine CoA-transferase CaiB-like acyl-CoA transferase
MKRTYNPSMSSTARTGPFAHLRILDLSQVRAGPACVRQFADFGADVIKIESPPSVNRTDLMTGARDGADMQNLHRNKRSITLNLKHAQGHRIFMKLVEGADVVVENFRPDVKDKLGIGYEALRDVNPRIVLASISGFGQDGPYRDKPGFDQIAQGMTGMMGITGEPDGPPLRSGVAIADMAAGLFAALGIMTALAERDKSGQGQWVQSNLLHAGIAFADFQAARYCADGIVAQRLGNDHPTSMPTTAFKTADGYINVGAAGNPMWQRFCAAIGRPEIADLPEFATDPLRAKNRALLHSLVGPVLATRASADWLQVLEAHDVPCGPIYRMDEVFADPQVQHIGVTSELAHPTRGSVHLIAQAATLSRTPAQLRHTLERQGVSTDTVLAEIGYSAADIAGLRAQGVV